MKKSNYLIICFLLMSFATEAQVNPEVVKRFPSNIISKIYEITSKVILPLEEQIQLGKYFRNRDSIANLAKIKGATAPEINKYYNTDLKEIRKILSPIEFSDYLFTNERSSSKFCVALKYRNQLNLNNLQIDSLLKSGDFVNNLQSGSEKKQFEAYKLGHILDQIQYMSLMKILYKDKILYNTNVDWQNIKKFNLFKKSDSSRIATEIFNYEINKIIDPELAKNIRILTKWQVKRNHIDVNKPFELLKIDAINGNLPISNFSTAIRLRSELNLTPNQIDLLLANILRIESLHLRNKKTTQDTLVYLNVKSQNTIVKILTIDQYNKFLAFNNQEKALQYAKEVWTQLYNLGLAKNLDSIQVSTLIFTYELNKKIAIEKAVDVPTYKKDGLEERPTILLKLDAYKNSLPKSQFADVIKLKKELNIEDGQFDLLISKVVQLEKLRTNYKIHNLEGRFFDRPFENENLIKILTTTQMETYLEFKNKAKATINAKRDWEKLKKSGLTLKTDSISINNENVNYELRILVANDHLLIENSQNNLFAKKDIENNKPQNLKQLDYMLNKIHADNNLKKTLTW